MDSIPQTKRCSRCRAFKPLADYHKQANSKDGHARYCKPCWKFYLADRRARRGVDAPATKRCTSCGLDKPIGEYYVKASQLDGYKPTCKACCQVYAKAHFQQIDKEQLQVYRRAQYETKRDAYIARAKASYQRNPEQAKRRIGAWTRAHPDRRRLYSRRMYARNPEPKRETWRRRHARKLAASIVPFIPTQLRDKCRYWGNRCWICRGPQEAIDHVKPLAKGGAHVLCNLRPICRACNTRKKDRWPYP